MNGFLFCLSEQLLELLVTEVIVDGGDQDNDDNRGNDGSSVDPSLIILKTLGLLKIPKHQPFRSLPG